MSAMNATLIAHQQDHRSAQGTAGSLTGTLRLFRFALRRDRVRIPAWGLGIGGMVAYFGSVIPIAYPDQAALQTRAAIMQDPSGALLTGPGYGIDNYTFGAMVTNELLGMLAVAAALMSIFLVVRHTRAEEESGRAELIRAGVVGNRAPLAAAVLTLLVANAAIGAALGGGLLASGLVFTDTLAVSAGMALVGLVFGGVAAVTAQLSEHARTASGMAGAALALAFLLRGIGDAQALGGSALSWFSPIAWAQQTRAFTDLRWWPLLLCVGLVAVLLTIAVLLTVHRDFGAGLVPARSGRGSARKSLVHPVGLILRMERGSIIGWLTGLVIFAVLTGSMGQGIVESFEAQPQLAAVFGQGAGGDVLRATLASFTAYFAMAVAVYAVISVNRLRGEESDGRTGAILATSVSRARWLVSSLAVTALGSTVMLLGIGLGLGVGAGTSLSDPNLALDFALVGLVYLPLVMAFAGLAALSYGVLRAGRWWVWLLLLGSIIVGVYGPLLNLPGAVSDAEPFGLMPRVPAEALSPGPVLGSALVALLLVTAGVLSFRRRDLEAG
ncbi:ABC transporter [Arthrobacter tumbae]|uniref:ABC transporter permease n=1 Tax=Arthrobacter tumbae TaxID=163874 RepID=UPI00195A28F9|nr:polyketide antibiotic transporter [Arthrobacter tumbae]MBM7781275.1 ABC-2 type transport system permease protein [Arthrobacter tumbae]